MPTLASIPGSLLNIDKRDDFRRWVRALPLNRDQRKELMFLWSNALETTWTAEEVHWALGPY